MSGERRDFLKSAGQLGFTPVGRDGRGHILLRDEAGQLNSATFSPGDYRSRRNDLADLERLAGRRLPRRKSGKYRNHRQPVSRFEKSPAERDYCRQVDELVAKADRLRAEFAELAAAGDRDAAVDARHVLLAFEGFQRQAARLHRIIPPIG